MATSRLQKTEKKNEFINYLRATLQPCVDQGPT